MSALGHGAVILIVLVSPFCGAVEWRADTSIYNCTGDFVFRNATSSDTMCVQPCLRDIVADENKLNMTMCGFYGPDTCACGRVWRHAYGPHDHVSEEGSGSGACHMSF